MAYRTAQTFTVQELAAIVERTRPTPPDPDDALTPSVLLETKTLPELDPGVLVEESSVWGYVSADREPFGWMEELLSHPRAQSDEVMCSYNFHDSSRERRGEDEYCDSITVRSESGGMSFGYSANGGSRVLGNPGYARPLLELLIAACELPITVMAEGSDYLLRHNDTESALSLLDAMLGGRNPTSFHCALPGESAACAVHRVRRGVEAVATRAVEHRWTLSNRTSDPVEVYRASAEPPFTADRYFVDLNLALMPVDRLDGLKAFCKRGKAIVMPIGTLPLERGKLAYLSVATLKDGHRLEVIVPRKAYLAQVETLTAVKFGKQVEDG